MLTIFEYIKDQCVWILVMSWYLITYMGSGTRWIFMAVRLVIYGALVTPSFLPQIIWYISSSAIIRRVRYRSSKKVKLEIIKALLHWQRASSAAAAAGMAGGGGVGVGGGGLASKSPASNFNNNDSIFGGTLTSAYSTVFQAAGRRAPNNNNNPLSDSINRASLRSDRKAALKEAIESGRASQLGGGGGSEGRSSPSSQQQFATPTSDFSGPSPATILNNAANNGSFASTLRTSDLLKTIRLRLSFVGANAAELVAAAEAQAEAEADGDGLASGAVSGGGTAANSAIMTPNADLTKNSSVAMPRDFSAYLGQTFNGNNPPTVNFSHLLHNSISGSQHPANMPLSPVSTHPSAAAAVAALLEADGIAGYGASVATGGGVTGVDDDEDEHQLLSTIRVPRNGGGSANSKPSPHFASTADAVMKAKRLFKRVNKTGGGSGEPSPTSTSGGNNNKSTSGHFPPSQAADGTATDPSAVDERFILSDESEQDLMLFEYFQAFCDAYLKRREAEALKARSKRRADAAAQTKGKRGAAATGASPAAGATGGNSVSGVEQPATATGRAAGLLASLHWPSRAASPQPSPRLFGQSPQRTASSAPQTSTPSTPLRDGGECAQQTGNQTPATSASSRSPSPAAGKQQNAPSTTASEEARVPSHHASLRGATMPTFETTPIDDIVEGAATVVASPASSPLAAALQQESEKDAKPLPVSEDEVLDAFLQWVEEQCDAEDNRVHNRATLDVFLPVPLHYLLTLRTARLKAVLSNVVKPFVGRGGGGGGSNHQSRAPTPEDLAKQQHQQAPPSSLKTPSQLQALMVGNAKPFKVCILVSGGAWIIGCYLWSAILARFFAAAGYVVFVPDYRNFPQADISGMVEDVTDAIVWVLRNAEVYNGDPTDVTVIGHSAGAHLSLLTILEQARACAAKDASANDAQPNGTSESVTPSTWTISPPSAQNSSVAASALPKPSSSDNHLGVQPVFSKGTFGDTVTSLSPVSDASAGSAPMLLCATDRRHPPPAAAAAAAVACDGSVTDPYNSTPTGNDTVSTTINTSVAGEFNASVMAMDRQSATTTPSTLGFQLAPNNNMSFGNRSMLEVFNERRLQRGGGGGDGGLTPRQALSNASPMSSVRLELTPSRQATLPPPREDGRRGAKGDAFDDFNHDTSDNESGGDDSGNEADVSKGSPLAGANKSRQQGKKGKKNGKHQPRDTATNLNTISKSVKFADAHHLSITAPPKAASPNSQQSIFVNSQAASGCGGSSVFSSGAIIGGLETPAARKPPLPTAFHTPNKPRFDPSTAIRQWIGVSGIYDLPSLEPHFNERGLYSKVLYAVAGYWGDPSDTTNRTQALKEGRKVQAISAQQQQQTNAYLNGSGVCEPPTTTGAKVTASASAGNFLLSSPIGQYFSPASAANGNNNGGGVGPNNNASFSASGAFRSGFESPLDALRRVSPWWQFVREASSDEMNGKNRCDDDDSNTNNADGKQGGRKRDALSLRPHIDRVKAALRELGVGGGTGDSCATYDSDLLIPDTSLIPYLPRHLKFLHGTDDDSAPTEESAKMTMVISAAIAAYAAEVDGVSSRSLAAAQLRHQQQHAPPQPQQQGASYSYSTTAEVAAMNNNNSKRPSQQQQVIIDKHVTSVAFVSANHTDPILEEILCGKCTVLEMTKSARKVACLVPVGAADILAKSKVKTGRQAATAAPTTTSSSTTSGSPPTSIGGKLWGLMKQIVLLPYTVPVALLRKVSGELPTEQQQGAASPAAANGLPTTSTNSLTVATTATSSPTTTDSSTTNPFASYYEAKLAVDKESMPPLIRWARWICPF